MKRFMKSVASWSVIVLLSTLMCFVCGLPLLSENVALSLLFSTPIALALWKC